MSKKVEERKEEKEESLLDQLCPNDAKLHDFLCNYLLVDPLAGISRRDLDGLTEEAIAAIGQIDADHLAVIGRTAAVRLNQQTPA